jgi:hypothetical protein
LHRTAQNIAAQTVRTDVRRRAREQEAVAMNELLSAEPDANWENIAPHLDAALGDLSEPDRDALLLRYFERKSAREMAHTLGISDEAAQKRVSRAVERLREFFAKRGVTVGASGLVVVISANAVQPAPAGLAVTISTAAALTGTTIASTAPVTATNVIAMTSMQKTMITFTAVVIAAFSIFLTMVWRQNSSLRRELAILRASTVAIQRPAEAKDTPVETAITEDELRRLRMDHLELLRLRGRFTQLADELRQLKAKGVPTGTSPNPASEPEDSILFSASLTNRVGSGQTLVVGGWPLNGMRRYLLLTPTIRNGDGIPDGKPMNIESEIVTAPESFWNQIGWGDAKSGTRRSTLAGVLTPEQLDMLIKVLKETKDTDTSRASPVARSNGEYVGFAFSIDDEHGEGTLVDIALHPWIAADGQSVDLEIRPQPVSTNVPIYPSLK